MLLFLFSGKGDFYNILQAKETRANTLSRWSLKLTFNERLALLSSSSPSPWQGRGLHVPRPPFLSSSLPEIVPPNVSRLARGWQVGERRRCGPPRVGTLENQGSYYAHATSAQTKRQQFLMVNMRETYRMYGSCTAVPCLVVPGGSARSTWKLDVMSVNPPRLQKRGRE